MTRRASTSLVAIAISLVVVACAETSVSPRAKSPTVLHVTVLTSPGCGQTDAAVAQVVRVARRLGVEPAVESHLVESADEATRRRMLGSPTIRIEGRDLERAARERTDFGLG